MGGRSRNVRAQMGDNGSPRVRLTLLGGFRVECGDVVPESAWQQRRSAKMLVKLLAAHPGHSLHREQVLEMLWPEVDFASAVNSLGKALHVARRALEPGMPSRGSSSYLRLADDILTLVTDGVWIDADHFETAAKEALRCGDIASLERALELYGGELLPEDTYESWTMLRRDALANLYLRLLLSLAEALEGRGDRELAIERLTQVLQLDPAREDVHRQLMRMHAEGGRRLQALRQYQLCCEVLKEEVDASPEAATVELYEDIRAGRFEQSAAIAQPAQRTAVTPALPPAIERLPSTPLVGRERVLSLLMDDFASAESGRGQMVMVSGEVGIGKTRLAADAARDMAQQGALVLWGSCHEQETLLPYGPFAEALETYMATRDAGERQVLAGRYPELASLLPSLRREMRPQPAVTPQEAEQSQLFAAILRALTDLAETQVVVLVLDDLHDASWESLQLVQHLARLGRQRRWLIMGTYREEDLAAGCELQRMLIAGVRQGFCRHVNLRRLARQDCDKLVHAALQGGTPAPTVLEQVYALSLGNPLFVIELLGAMRGRDELILADGYWQVIPSTAGSVPRQVANLVDLRLERLGDRAQRVLSLVAVSGGELSFDELWSAAQEVLGPDITEATLLDILDSGLQSRILEETGTGYAFMHPLFCAALCDQLSHRRRMQLHSAIAHVIEVRRPGEDAALGYHYSRSAESERAVASLERAARCAHAHGMRETEEAHLWELLQRLHLLGRREAADRVRRNLRTLLKDIALYDSAQELPEQAETGYRLQDAIA
ncbi:MAG: AAA family ATPase [Chloroflexi bacterium]|nr:AAA family ATPase [Chloroflexota bacterium]